ncbi:hypothetical protein DN752_16260 [Echinicola strongylocentroti]|uniref:Uncharacterized protein n=1 Tax=Echinicola strongylocentroti TaxID=1795355 RepID=A0A2Z4IMD1_9BACT|nr:hypothetical protein [Echinicola strongylocentroti]AWW31553.1 hypothetical protein DN752_16260 [Echinicola strongylocentroti]
MEFIINYFTTNPNLIKAAIIISGYFLTFLITNYLIKKIVLKDKEASDVDKDGKIAEADKKIIRDGYIIGKCENIIILSFVLAGEITGLALIFAAKNLARQKDINDNAGFFLAGTMVNFTTSLVLGFCIKFILTFIP